MDELPHCFPNKGSTERLSDERDDTTRFRSLHQEVKKCLQFQLYQQLIARGFSFDFQRRFTADYKIETDQIS